jgi:hypothetical protein
VDSIIYIDVMPRERKAKDVVRVSYIRQGFKNPLRSNPGEPRSSAGLVFLIWAREMKA